MKIVDKLISLVPYAKESVHEFYCKYIADPLMRNDIYSYNIEKADEFYYNKVLDPSRHFFGINLNGMIIGEIQLKHIDVEQGCGTLSIHLSNDTFKNHGYGTEAEG